jgi:hypothetical protein
MRDFLILFVHLVVTVARLARPGGLRSVVAESVAGPGRGRDISYPIPRLVKILVGSLRSCLRQVSHPVRSEDLISMLDSAWQGKK